MARELNWPFSGQKLSSVPLTLTDRLCSGDAEEESHSLVGETDTEKGF